MAQLYLLETLPKANWFGEFRSPRTIKMLCPPKVNCFQKKKAHFLHFGLENPIDRWVDQYFKANEIDWNVMVDDRTFLRRIYPKSRRLYF